MAGQVAERAQGEMAFHAGLSAEATVARAYQSRGLAVAEQRWRGSAGEVDIVLRDGARVIFVEVKKSGSFARAAASLSHRQIERLFSAASEFLGGEPRGLLTEARFDVALVDGSGAVEIHENALMC